MAKKGIDLRALGIVKERSIISASGAQLLLRIPKRIIEVIGIKKGDAIWFHVKNPKSKNKKLIIDYEVSK